MPMLKTLTLRVTDVAAQKRIYSEVLGMTDQGEGLIGFSEREVALRFVQAETPYAPQRSDLYWKIALSAPNIELACAQLQRRGVAVTAPQQFRDVGYLAKLTDPEGFTIELIDHWFQGERPEAPCDETRLGGGAHLSLVTLRTADVAAVEPFILGLGLETLSIQPVAPYGFTLYFYGGARETPPSPDLTAIDNRSWVYRRPYSVLEIQHVHNLTTETRAAPGAGGYAGLDIAAGGPSSRSERLQIQAGGGASG